MLSFRSRVRAAFLGLALVGSYAGSVQAGTAHMTTAAGIYAVFCVVVGRFLVRNAKSFRAVTDGSSINAEMPADLRYGKIDALDDDAPIVPSVAFLGRPVGPSAIGGLIVPVRIYAIERKAERGLSHVFQEVLELQPSLTNLDAAPAVPLEPMSVRVCASLPHGHPTGISARAPLSACAAVGARVREVLERRLNLQTPARPGRPVSQLRFVNNDFIPAGAAA